MSDTPITDAAYFERGATMYSLAGEMKNMERQNADLREDKERLEFCLRQGMWIFSTDPKERGAIIPILDRAAIDAARKETKP